MNVKDIGPGAIFYTADNTYIRQYQVTEARERAFRVKVFEFARLRKNDDAGRFMGFAWVPKKALVLENEKTGLFKFANWFKTELWMPKSKPQKRLY